MSSSNRVITVLTLSVGLVISIALFKLIIIEKEKIETQCRIQFEERSSEIRKDIENRRTLLKKKWEDERQQVLNEGIKLISLYSGQPEEEKAHNQVAQWMRNMNDYYKSAEADLRIEEATKIAELRKRIWAK